MQLGGAGNRNDPRLLRKEPSKCKLGRGHLLAGCNASQHVYERPVRLTRLRCKARHGIAEVLCAERGLGIDRAGQEALSEWAERHEADTKFLKDRKDFLFGLTPPE